MTTIAWDHETVVADSQMTIAEASFETPDGKLERFGNFIFGKIGDCSNSELLLDWYRNGANKEKPIVCNDKADAVAVVISKTEVLYIGAAKVENSRERFVKVHKMPSKSAIGSGSRLAIGALLAGADAKSAVEIACKVDIYSSEPLTILER